MTTALLVAALLMGFFGSPHCLGMCGGLVTAFGLSMKDASPAKRRALVATYHLGRLSSYALLGLIAGLIGTTVLAPLMMGNSMPRILLGLVLVFVGVTMLGAPFLNKLERFGMRFWQYLSPLRQKVFPLNTFPRALTAGLLWGFLPCGLVYGALLIAVVAHNPLSGAALMFVFGLGTIPMLVATHETVGWLRDKIGRFRLRQLNGAVMVLSGLAVAVVPMVMASMHGGHGDGHAQMDHSNHAAMMSEADTTAPHDMSQMNHDMATDMNHNMQDMDNDMDHSMHDMGDDAASMMHAE
ncbi:MULTISPECIES: sulfite exporter TauE/SafE family protein [unclassified Psychrobacter]|uniref:urease accessory protein UreH domain-containing protein n=1 Tax=unclassified Psychrobacter TaxID=196806 RepID=UPI0025B5E532|nr:MULTISPECIES: sulfite exporter TauE/SafE family protein [unclassified Psychrobacter]MDN3454021.1 sulfite exporter TauE/SafE family protein [Psychrobacter sp. APC 3350]MDN3503265.1 sulfite exporter TauE/SafE family protein [Psychrobacter sp. 5A.1]